jgi:hypothetical protein
MGRTSRARWSNCPACGRSPPGEAGQRRRRGIPPLESDFLVELILLALAGDPAEAEA